MMIANEVETDVILYKQIKRKQQSVLCKSNVAFKSLKKALTAAIERKGEDRLFEPVCWAIVNELMIGHIGMIRHFNGYIEFSYYDASRNDCDAFKRFVNLGKSWELAAIEDVNNNIDHKGNFEDRNLIKIKVPFDDLKPAINKLNNLLNTH
jgi:hypothetical protein